MAGDAIALRCVCVIRGTRTPFVVDVTSSNDDAFGVVVPMPAAPEYGKVFCAFAMEETSNIIITVPGSGFKN